MDSMMETSLNVIDATEYVRLLAIHVATGESAVILGPPGCGKTQLARQTCPSTHHYVEVSVQGMTDLELAGPTMPDTATREATAYKPAWYAQAWAAAPDRPWFVLIDELTMASTDGQRVCTSILEDHHVRGWRLPPGSVVIATGNRTMDGTRAVPVLSTLRSRASVYDLQPEPLAWLRWAQGAGIDPRITTYIAENNGALVDDGSGAVNPESAFPCPRTWTKLSRKLQANGNAPVSAALVAGSIGDAAARRFIDWLPSYASVSFVGFEMDPLNAPTPADPAEGELAKRAIAAFLAKATPETALAHVRTCLRWIDRFGDAETRRSAGARVAARARELGAKIAEDPDCTRLVQSITRKGI